MNIFNLKIMTIKKYEEEQNKYKKQIKDLKDEKDADFWTFNRKIQDYQAQCDFTYNKKLNEEKTKIKKEFEFLRVIRNYLDKAMVSDPEEYNKWLDCYYKVRKNILDYKI